jgi:hypothetical protein
MLTFAAEEVLARRMNRRAARTDRELSFRPGRSRPGPHLRTQRRIREMKIAVIGGTGFRIAGSYDPEREWT